MKHLFTLLIVALFTATALLPQKARAQSPEEMSYQAVIRDTDGNLVVNTTVGMQISILQGSKTGTGIYIETQTLISNANGLVSLEIGTGIVQNGKISNVVFLIVFTL